LDDFDAGLADDLNTAVALAATFDFVRERILRWIVAEFGQEDVGGGAGYF